MDRRVFSLRPDLMLTGRTLVGRSLCEEREESFLTAPRVKASLKDAKQKAAHLGIELDGIDASQEIFSCQWKSSLMSGVNAARQCNILRELVSEAAAEKGLICLFHEKPFRDVKGSSIQLRWTLQTDGGQSLLDPLEDRLLFSILTAALFRGLHRHESLIWGCISSLGNDACFSEKMGKEIEPGEELFVSLENGCFVFHGVGSGSSLILLITALQATLAQSLEVLLDELEGSSEKKIESVLQREFFLQTKQKKCPEVYKAFLEPAASQMFEDIFTEKQLEDLFASLVKRSAMAAERESRVFIDLFRTQILPACLAAQEKLTTSLQTILESPLTPSPRLTDELSNLSKLISESLAAADELERVLEQMQDLGWEAKAKVLSELIEPKREWAREYIDMLEQIVADVFWPIPKYRELLYSALCSGSQP
ncbi:MAG: hypothetical protein IT584_02190 [Chlamydiae bacterium]|nr:hypothetical protein [Chlamydiota bacterium]